MRLRENGLIAVLTLRLIMLLGFGIASVLKHRGPSMQETESRSEPMAGNDRANTDEGIKNPPD